MFRKVAFSIFLSSLTALSVFSSVMAEEPDALTRQLFEAIAKNDFQTVDRAIKEGARTDFQDRNFQFGATPLIQALQYFDRSKDPGIVLLLLSQPNIALNARNNFGESALHLAAEEKSHLALSGILERNELNFYQLDQKGRTVFYRTNDVLTLSLLEAYLHKQVPDESKDPSFLIVNFIGLGGGGEIYDRATTQHPQVDFLFALRRNRLDQKTIRERITSWMRFSKELGGPRNQKLILVGSSWGASPTRKLAKWFKEKFQLEPAAIYFVDAANWLGLPALFTPFAALSKNYFARGFHWPKGWKMMGAENVPMEKMDHDSALSVGASLVSEDIRALIQSCSKSQEK